MISAPQGIIEARASRLWIRIYASRRYVGRGILVGDMLTGDTLVRARRHRPHLLHLLYDRLLYMLSRSAANHGFKRRGDRLVAQCIRDRAYP